MSDFEAPFSVVRAPEAGSPNGHYSHAIACNGMLYVSGQLGRGPRMSDADAGDIVVQTRRALVSLATVVRAGGSDLAHLVQVTLYIADIANWPAVNAVYAEVLAEHRPARAVVPVGPLHYGALVEIAAIAALS